MQSLLALFVPWLLLLLVFFIIILLVIKKWKIAIFFTIITMVLNWWCDCFCIGLFNDFCGDVKVLSFNINGEGAYNKTKEDDLLLLVEKEKPEILFLTENFSPRGDSLHLIFKQLFPYDSRDVLNHNVIYSKYKMKSIKRLKKIENSSAFVIESHIFIKGKEIVVYGAHLSSNNYTTNLDYVTPESDKTITGIKDYLSNIVCASKLREKESSLIINTFPSTTPVIVMGDLNDVTGSSTLQAFSSSGLKDAWSKKGFGYGATIHHPLPYRIDHILYNEGLKLKGIKKIDANGISDHDALMAVFDFE